MRDALEVMARAVCRRNCRVFNLPYNCNCVCWEEHKPDIEAALTAYESHLQAEGMAVVPVEPTEAMLDSGGSSIIRPSIYMGGTPPGAKRRARDVWAAMLATHTQEKDNG